MACLKISITLAAYNNWSTIHKVIQQMRWGIDIWAASWQNQWHVRPSKTQISLGICPVWSESSLSTWRQLGSLATHWAHSEDSDQTGQMPRLIRVFPGCTCQFFGFVMKWLIYKMQHANSVCYPKYVHSSLLNFHSYLTVSHTCQLFENFMGETAHLNKVARTWKLWPFHAGDFWKFSYNLKGENQYK